MSPLRGSFLMFLLVAIGVGCTSPPPPAPLVPRTPEEKSALLLAQGFVTAQGLNWGSPKAIGPDGQANTFWVSYPTPEAEVKRISDRAVVVDVKSGTVRMAPRK